MNQNEALALLRETVISAARSLGALWTVGETDQSPGKGGVYLIAGGDHPEDVLVWVITEKRKDERFLRVQRMGWANQYVYSTLDYGSIVRAVVEVIPWDVSDSADTFPTVAHARNYFRKIIAKMDGWEVDQEKEQIGIRGWTLEAVSPSLDARISFCATGNGDGNIQVRGVWPKDVNDRDCVPPGTDDIVINMSAGKRTPLALANDVKRRLVMDFLAPNALALLTKAKRNQWITKGNDLWNNLVKEAGKYGDPDEGRQRLRLNTRDDDSVPFQFGEVTVVAGTAKLEVRGLPPATALQIIRLLCSKT